MRCFGKLKTGVTLESMLARQKSCGMMFVSAMR
jgi:hypothetical protein